MLTVKCQGCGAQIRFPVNRGKIRVRCPWCQAWFVFAWHPANLWDLAKRKLSGLAPRLPAGRAWDIKATMTALFIAAVLVVAAMQVCDPGH
jgi:LSD1 subclass zinc finger protein